MASKEILRKRLNNFHNRLSYSEKAVFHSLFAKIFRSGQSSVSDGIWSAGFVETKIKLPIRNAEMWLDWDTAISIVGHDVDIKITYETLLNSTNRPQVFFDIGANYGTHSLLFISQGVTVKSFEPNPNCSEYFEECCRLNNFDGKFEKIALGDFDGSAELYFPEKQTWLGTIVSETKKDLENSFKLNIIPVQVSKLDTYVERSGLIPDLIKIDTEGNELSVIKGAQNTIEKGKPFIIFETNEPAKRKCLAETFRGMKYEICDLPLYPGKPLNILSNDDFQNSLKTNFIAVDNERIRKWK